MPEISVVVPVYLGEPSVERLHAELTKALAPLVRDYEIVLVDDCSPDRSWEIISALCDRDPKTKGIRFTRNFGQHRAITAGLGNARGDWMVLMDCDLQDLPEDIPKLYSEAKKGFDCVIGVRNRQADPWLRVFFSRAFYRIFGWLLNRTMDPRLGSFRILSRRAVDQYLEFRERVRLFGDLMEWLAYPTAYVEVQHAPSVRGRSSYGLLRLAAISLEMLLVHSDRLLRIVIGVGFGILISAFVFGTCYALWAVYRHTTVIGWSSLILSIYLFSGVIIALLGLIGLYVGKTLEEVRSRPLYVVRALKNFPPG